MQGIDINRITIFAMELYPDSEDTEQAVFSLLCDTPIAYANEVDLLRPPHAQKADPRVTIASALEAAEENVFARMDAIEDEE